MIASGRRRLWGSIINETRNLGRAARVFMKGDRELLEELLLWTIAFPHAVMNSLRGSTGLGRHPPSGSPPARSMPCSIPAMSRWPLRSGSANAWRGPRDRGLIIRLCHDEPGPERSAAH